MGIVGSVSVARRGVNNWKFQLVLVCPQLDKQVKHFVDDFFRACTGAIDLIKHDYRLFPKSKCLFQNKTRLRHTALKSVYQKQNAVDHC